MKLSLGGSILLCDEATSALDPKTTRDILRLVKDIALPSLFGVDRRLGTSEQMRLRRFADLSRHNFVVIS